MELNYDEEMEKQAMMMEAKLKNGQQKKKAVISKPKKTFDSEDYFKRKEEESDARWLRITEGLALYKDQQFERAQIIFKALLDESNGSDKTQFYRPYADCFRKRQLYPEALEVYNEGYSSYKSSPNELDKLEFAALVNNRGLTFRALEQYDKAAQDFDEALQNVTTPNRFLYMCNKGHVLYLSGQKEPALKCIKEAFDFVQKYWDQLDNHLSEGQINYIKSRFKEFMGEFNQLQEINLKISDEILNKREDAYILKNIQDIETKGEEPEPENEEKDKFIQILDAKEKLKIIHSNVKLYQYYDGFLYTLSQGYAVALVVNSGTLSVNTDSDAASAVTALVSLIPLVGEKVSKGVGAVYSFVKEALVKRAATNVCSFATTISEFETMAQNVVLDSILKRKNEIEKLDPKPYLLPSWAVKFRNFVHELNANIYGERNKTPMQKLGYQTASSLIEKYIASGDIYSNQEPVWILPDEKEKRLLDISLTLLDKNIQEWDKKSGAQEGLAYDAAGQKHRTHCCEMF